MQNAAHEESERSDSPAPPARVLPFRTTLLIVLAMFLAGLAGAYLVRGSTPALGGPGDSLDTDSIVPLSRQVYPVEGYALSVSYSDLGPRLLEAGAIDYYRFVQLYEQQGKPLSDDQLAILTLGSREAVIINRQNAHFLLNFFWALGLVNQNPILTEGPITAYAEGDVGRFASTGGWILGARPPTDLFASARLLDLSAEQQARLEMVAGQVFRPCCNNPTIFPDCNHGMALLGLLTLLASQDASEGQMFEAAKYANAFWFPQQTLEMAIYLEATLNTSFAEADARLVVGPNISSGTGFRNVHNWLAGQGILEQPSGSSSCGV